MVKPPVPRDSLLAYLRVQEYADREMYALLRRAATDVKKDILRLTGDNIGAVIRREQLIAANAAIHTRIADLLQASGRVIEANRVRASVAGVETFQQYERVLFDSLTDTRYVQAYMRAAKETAAQGMESMLQRMQGPAYHPLAESVYKTTQLSTGMVDRFVNSALARGFSARELAAGVASMIRPDVKGGVSYAAMRLARTEINNAFHATQAEKARTSPWTTGVMWNLSGSHGKPDTCDEYAESEHYPNAPRGYYKPNDIPRKPHPHCLCHTTPYTLEPDEFLDQLFAGEFDNHIDDVMERSGYDRDYITSSRVAFHKRAERAAPGRLSPQALAAQAQRVSAAEMDHSRATMWHNFSLLDYADAVSAEDRAFMQAAYYGKLDSLKINKHLRTGVDADEFADTAARIAEIVGKWPLPEDIVTYRGLIGVEFPEDIVGSVIRDAAFQSTTSSREYAVSWLTRGNFDKQTTPNTLLRILSPKGTPVSMSTAEYEVLLQRGSGLRVVLDQIDETGLRVLTCVVE